MNGIAGIDSGSPWLARDNAGASPAHDFADELAKDEPRTASHGAPARERPRDSNVATELGGQTEVESSDSRLDESPRAILPADALSDLPIEQQQALQPVAPVGITQAFIGARVFGLHLSAQGYLSVLSAAQLADEGRSGQMSSVDMAATMEYEQGNAVSATVRSMAPEAPTSTTVVASMGMQAGSLAQFEVDGTHTAVASEALAGASASAVVWPERVIRTVRDSNQGLSIWLRDYRTNADETSKLVGQLIEHARIHGEHLNRIILNGREVWTSRGGTNQGDVYVG